MNEWRNQAPPLLAELADHAAAVLVEMNFPPAQADQAAFEIVRRFAAAAGGVSIYIPKIDHLLRHEREEAISREFKGDNVQALARKYGVSEVWIYAIIRRQRSLKRQKEKKE
jgi:Mor family transcriptional regulator